MRSLPVVVLTAVLLLCGCGPRAITKGSHPFPAKTGIFTDASGKILFGFPDSEEPYRLAFLDFAWCPACQSAWEAVMEASTTAAPGSVRIYRILFDRETLFTESGEIETAPLRAASRPGTEFRGNEGNVTVTTLTAIPAAFRKEFRVSHAPLLLLLSREGEVKRRWQGYSTNLKEEISAELSKIAPYRSSPPT